MSSNLATPAGFTAQDLVFQDNFSGTSLNTSSWNTLMASNGSPWDTNGDGGSGLGNTYNADYFMPSQVSVNNGLTLTAIQQSVLGDVSGTPTTFPVTSGIVDTDGKMEFTGGYLQISMKASSGDGAWPALWLLPGASAGNVGNNFELDMEEGGFLDGSANPNDVFSYHLEVGSPSYGGSVNTGTNLTSGYNTYAINWIPGQSITWYLNGTEMGEITSAQHTIPDEPMELIMCNSVGNSNSSSWRTSLDSSTPQSMPMEVADVQLYQAPGSGDTITGGNVTSDPPPTSAPTVTIANPTLSVTSHGGTVSLGVSVTAPNSSTATTVKITGLPSYESITDNLDTTKFQGSSVTLSEAEVDSGLTLTSNYRGHGHPSATLTTTASDTIRGVTSVSVPQTLTVNDPPPSGSGFSANALANEFLPFGFNPATGSGFAWNWSGSGDDSFAPAGSGLAAVLADIRNGGAIPTSSSHGGEPVFPVPDLAAFAFTTKNAALQ